MHTLHIHTNMHTHTYILILSILDMFLQVLCCPLAALGKGGEANIAASQCVTHSFKRRHDHHASCLLPESSSCSACATSRHTHPAGRKNREKKHDGCLRADCADPCHSGGSQRWYSADCSLPCHSWALVGRQSGSREMAEFAKSLDPSVSSGKHWSVSLKKGRIFFRQCLFDVIYLWCGSTRAVEKEIFWSSGTWFYSMSK